MEIIAPEEGEIPGTQSRGEVGVWVDFLQKKPQLLRGERQAFSGRAGENKFRGGGFRAGDDTVGTVLRYSLLHAQLQTSSGQRAGDEDTAVWGMGTEGFWEEEGNSHAGEHWR